MSKLYLTPILVVWLAITAQAQLTNNGTIVNRGNLISDWQMPYVITAGGWYTGINGGFEHRGPATRTLVNDGTYVTSGNHTDKFMGPGGQPGAQEIAGTKRPQFINLLFANGANSALNITNPTGISVVRSLTFANGVTTTVRSLTSAGALVFTDTATYAGGSTDAQHVNGYVGKIGKTGFVFPVGSGTNVRSLTVSVPATVTATATDHYSVAWMAGDPTTTTDPSNASATHPITNRQAGLSAISPAGQWDWITVSGTGAGLIITVSLPNLTSFATASALRLVGWNGSQWITLSTGAKPYLNGASYASGNAEGTTLQGTMVAGITAIGIGASLSASLSGRILNDGNGLTDSLVNQVGNGPNPLNGTDIDPQAAGRQVLYTTLVDSSGAALNTVAVSSTGTYVFHKIAAGTYSVVLSTDSTGHTSALLPANWVATGEYVGTGVGSDGRPDGILTGIVVRTDSVTNANFGINKRPRSAPVTLAAQPNPGGSVQVPVSATAFTGTDLEDGTYANNLTGRPVALTPATGGTLYYNGSPVSTTLATTSFDPAKVSIDPTAPGATTAVFTYSVQDNAGVGSEPSTVTLPFSDPVVTLSGFVFDDANGLTDNTVNGVPLNATAVTPISSPAQALYVTLVSSGTALSTVAVSSTGMYSFTGVNPGMYSVALSTNPAGSTGASLPADWVNTGEQLGTDPGSDGTPNGILTGVAVGSTSLGNANFGVNRRPQTTSIRLAAQPNLAGIVSVSATAFAGTDLEDGTYANNLTDRPVTLSPATGGTLYYYNSPVSVSLATTSFDPTKLTLRPTASGATTVFFTYSVKDNAGISSEPDTITLPFTARPLTLSGRIFDDGNGLTDNLVNQVGNGPDPLNGTDIDPQVAGSQALYATLVSSNGLSLTTVAVSSAGTYRFGSVNSGAYSVVLSTNPAGSASASLPADWVNTGEQLGTGVGSDGTPDGSLTGLVVQVDSVINANFAINKRPQIANAAIPPQPTPGGNGQVVVPATVFNATDLEDGTYSANLAGRAVTLTPATGGTLYYNGSPVSSTISLTDFVPTQVTLEPGGPQATTVVFSYSVKDNAGTTSDLANPSRVSAPFTGLSITITGTVFDDANGMIDNTVNGVPLNGTAVTPIGGTTVPLYASLWQASSQIATVPINSEGTYSFRNVAPNATYSIILGTNPAGSNRSSSLLPNSWVPTGEHVGVGPGRDSLVDGVLDGVIVTQSNLTNANFGLNRRPQVAPATLAAQPNPGGSVQVPVSATAFTGTDLEDGTYANNLTGRPVALTPATGGTLYYNGSPVSTTLATTSFDPAKVSIDPTAPGATTAVFTYSVQDNAGYSSDRATITLPLTARPVALSGRIFDDANGLTDTLVNGVPLNATAVTPISGPAQALYVTLVSSGTALSTVAVSDTGTYRFGNVTGGTYAVVLSTNPAGSTGASLPADWVNTGEHVGTDPGSDGLPDGILTGIVVQTDSVSNANLGVNRRPQVAPATLAAQPNPGGSVQVPVSATAFTGTDLEDGTYANNLTGQPVVLTPATGGTLYYNAVIVNAALTVDRFDPAKVGVDPTATGSATVKFTYSVKDRANVPSKPDTITVPFTAPAVALSGKVFNDANGLNDNLVNQYNGYQIVGPRFGPNQSLYATLVNAGNQAIATVPVAPLNTYSFTAVNPGTYSVVLSLNPGGSTSSSLPSVWANTGEHLGTGPGSDGTPDGILTGIVVGSDAVNEANFGLDQIPTAYNRSVAAQANPKGTGQASLFGHPYGGDDTEDGSYLYFGRRAVLLKPATGGTLYYAGTPVVTETGIASFDPNKVSIDPTASGQTVATFAYAVRDDAGVASNFASVTVPFYNNEEDDNDDDDGSQDNPDNQVQLPNNTFSTVIPSVLIPPVAPLIAGVLIPAFPPGLAVLTVNGTTYTPDTFPPEGVIVATDPNGVTTGTVSVQPINPAVAVAIPFVAISIAGVVVTVIATTNTTPATLTNNGPLSCTATTVTLTATGEGTYQFSAGATPVNGGNTATVSLAGTYSVTVVGANGYRATASTTVTEDKGAPTATLINNGPLSCSATSVTLTAAGGTAYRFSNGAAQVNNGPTATVSDAGVYSVTVTGSNGCTATAQTTVASRSDSLRFVSQPASASIVTEGSAVTTSVSVTGTGPVTYQWYKNTLSNAVVSQTSATLSLSATQPSDAGRYFVVVTGTCNSLTSTAFELTVRADSLVATFVANPKTLLTSDTTTLSASVSGGKAPYRYQFAGPGILTPGSGPSVVKVSGLSAGVQTFTVVVSDATSPASLTTSATVSVTVNPANTAPVATTNATQEATVGSAFSYTVNAFTDAETPNSLTYTARISPANGLRFDAATRVISGIPDSTGALRVVVTATDPGSLSASTSFTIVVGPPTSTTGVVISQIYGGGGDSGAAYKNDFVELFNRGKDTVSITGWSIQFARTTATTWQSTTLTGSIPPGGYYLVQGAAGSSTAVTTNLPTPDAVGTINLDSTAGLVALVKTSSALSGTCPTGSTIVDFVGYGSAARCYEGSGTAAGSLTPTLAFLRQRDGCTDTDDNRADFRIGPVIPRNAASPTNDCGALVVQLTASPATLLTSGTTTLSAEAAGGTAPYRYSFTGPGTLTPGASTSTVSMSALSAGVQTFTVVVTDTSQPTSLSASATVSVTVSPANTAPTLANALSSQTATVGQSYSLSLAGVFTDAETPSALTLTASGLPAGLTLSGTTLSGTPSASSVSSVRLTATDAGGLTASTSFSLTVQPAPVVVPPLSVTLTASPITLLTTDRIDLSATASGGTVPYGYTFSGPGSFSLISLNTMSVSGLVAGVHIFTVVVNDATLPTSQTATATVSVTVSPANTAPVATTNATQVATVGSAFSYTVNAFTDDEPASQLTYLARIVPVNGLSFDPATRTLGGTPSVTGVSSVTVTAIDRGNLSASTTFDVVVDRAPVVTVASLSGTVFDDGNGLTDNLVNGAPLNATAVVPISAPAQALYVTLVSNGAALTTVAVSSTGTYRFNNLAAGAYSVVLNTDSTGRTTALLPTDWAATGEQLGTGPGSDGTPNGILTGIAVQTDSVTNANFGINRRPQTTSLQLVAQPNLGSSVTLIQAGIVFAGADLEDGTYPNNLTGRSVTLTPASGGTLYYYDGPISTPLTTTRFDPTKLTLKPTASGTTTVSFTYSVKDNAGVSSEPDTITVPFTARPLTLSGRIFDDGNGLSDGLVNQVTNGLNPLNGEDIDSQAVGRQALYATLVSSNGLSLTTVAVSSAGTYRFSTANLGTYSVVLSTNPAGSLTASLPADWVNTGEQLGTGAGSDGTPNGILTGVVVQADSVTNANFGLNRRPQTTSRTLTIQSTLNTSVPVPVAAFTGSDLEDGVYPNNLTGRPVTIMPATGGKLYYWDSPVDPVLPTTRFDPTKLTLIVSDPGATAVVFTYSVKDNAGVSSEVDTITLVLSRPVVVPPLSVSLTASPASLLTSGSTTLSAQVAGGTAPYRFTFSGPGTLTPGASTSTVSMSALSAGVQTFTVVVTDTSQPTSLSASATVSVTVSPANTAPTLANALSSQTATVGQSYSLSLAGVFTDAETPSALTLTASGLPAGLTLSGTTLSGTPSASGVSSVTLTATDAGGLSTSTSFGLSVQPALVVVPPLSVTLTASPTTLLTTDTTRLAAQVAGGKVPYSYNFSGPGTLVANGNLAGVSSLSAGVQTFRVLVTDAASQTATATVSVTVTGPAATTALRVLYLDADGKQTNNFIKPNLQVANVGTSPIPYGQLTLRYWLTVENFAPLTNLSVYYAPLGSDKVKMKYVELNQPRQGALGYVEYSFDPSVGSLVAGGNSGTIQTGIAKQDYSNFNEADDYSFLATGGLTPNSRITAYLNGVLVWGEEPPVVAVQQRLKAYTQSRNSGANTISTYLQIRNEGNIGADYSEVKVRYYLTAEGSQLLNFFLDYAVLGNDNVKGQFVRINPPLANADTYLELSFSAGLGKLNPGGSTGDIQYRIAKTDWSNFNQNNDYSYLTGNDLAENGRVVIYVAGKRVWGEEPSATGGRLAAEARSEVPLQVTVLGNPVTGNDVAVEVRGAEGQGLHLQLNDSRGRLIGEQHVPAAGAVEHQRLSVGSQPAGVLLLRVSTPTQSQTVKVLKAN